MRPKESKCFDKQQSVNFGYVFDMAFGNALAVMLGDIPVVVPLGNSLLPPEPDCVEVGATRVIGGIRPQNYDAAYRPDGVRVVYDSKSLNDIKSVGKNWQNMINDLATEAVTVHTRFPYALVCFIVAVPSPALGTTQEANLIRTLERMNERSDVLGQPHLAESIALVVWDPATGNIDTDRPGHDSNLRIEKFSDRVYQQYIKRYKGLPPHD